MNSETTTEPNWSEWFSPERTGYYLASRTKETLPQDLPEATIILEKVPDSWRLPDDPYDQIAMWKGQDLDFDEPIYQGERYANRYN